MSMTPEAMSDLLTNPQTAGYLGAAMGLLQSSGASRLPVTMGAAMGNAMQNTLPYQTQAYQNAIQRMMLPLTMAKIQWAMQNPSASQSLSQLGSGTVATAQSPSQDELKNLDKPSEMPSLFDPNLAADALNPTGTVSNGHVADVTSTGHAHPASQQKPVVQGDAQQYTSPEDDPIYQYYTRGAQLGWPNAAQLAQQRLQMLTQYSPTVQAELARARSLATLQNVRAGGSVYDPLMRQIQFYSPALGQGQVLGQNGQVSLSPGYLQSATQSQIASNLAKNATTLGPPVANQMGTTSARTVAGALGQPTTAAGIVAQATGQPIVTTPPGTANPRGIPVAVQPRAVAVPQTIQGVTTLAGGVPAPTNLAASSGRGPISLGAPTTAALTTAMKDSTQSLQDAIAGGTQQQMALGSLAEMNVSLNNLATGPGAAYRVQLEKLADGIGGTLGIKVPAFADITNSQVLTKTTTQFAEQAVGTNNQNAVRALDIVGHMVPSIGNTAVANQINAGTLTATAAYREAQAKFAQSWAQAYNGVGMDSKNGRWDGVWQQKAPFMAFLLNQLPPQAISEIFKYASTNKTLAMQIRQAQAAVPWLTHYGYLPSASGGNNGS